MFQKVLELLLKMFVLLILWQKGSKRGILCFLFWKFFCWIFLKMAFKDNYRDTYFLIPNFMFRKILGFRCSRPNRLKDFWNRLIWKKVEVRNKIGRHNPKFLKIINQEYIQKTDTVKFVLYIWPCKQRVIWNYCCLPMFTASVFQCNIFHGSLWLAFFWFFKMKLHYFNT